MTLDDFMDNCGRCSNIGVGLCDDCQTDMEGTIRFRSFQPVAMPASVREDAHVLNMMRQQEEE